MANPSKSYKEGTNKLSKEQVSGLFALGICAFAIGTTEFIAVGLVPLVAESFQLTVASAGSMVSLYAVGVAIGAPVLTYFGSALSRKRVELNRINRLQKNNSCTELYQNQLNNAFTYSVTKSHHRSITN